MTLDPAMFLAVLPEILLLVLGGVVLLLDFILPKEQHRLLGWVTAFGMLLVMLFSIPGMPGESTELSWGGMVRHDWLAYTFKMLFIFGAGITALFAMDYREIGERGAFYLLMIISTIGMCFMASASDLVMLYLAIETTSIPLYILAGFIIKDDRSSEAGFKYLLFGAMTSAVMLYGFSLIYGFSGTTTCTRSPKTGWWRGPGVGDHRDDAAGPGRFRFQDFGRAPALLGAGYIRWSADPRGRLPVDRFQGCRFCSPGAGFPDSFPPDPGRMGSCPGCDILADHDGW